MKNKIKLAAVTVVAAAMLMSPTAARADGVELGLAFLFPIPVPVPIYKIDHEPSTVTLGLLFPIPVPLPVYDYGDHKAGTGKGEAAPVRYARVQTMVHPKDASVFVDGEYMGRAGDFYFRKDALTVRPGAHRVELRAEGYEDYIAEVDVRPGGLVNIRRDLAPVR